MWPIVRPSRTMGPSASAALLLAQPVQHILRISGPLRHDSGVPTAAAIDRGTPRLLLDPDLGLRRIAALGDDGGAVLVLNHRGMAVACPAGSGLPRCHCRHDDRPCCKYDEPHVAPRLHDHRLN